MFVTAPPPRQAQPAPADPPHLPAPAQGGIGIGRFLGLLCGLIAYGKDLADRLRQGAATHVVINLAKLFGTTDLPAIILRITRGLRLAAALHERLARRAARGRDITPLLPRVSSRRKPATSRPSAPRARPQAAPDDVTLPTPEQIAALLRRRPLGAARSVP